MSFFFSQMSPLYGFVRSRQLEGTYPGEPSTGIWPTTAMRVLRGWGAVRDKEWIYEPDSWPPNEPPGLDKKAKNNRVLRYQRIHDALECKWALAFSGPLLTSFEITSQWFSAANGIIELPSSEDEMIGSHAVVLTGYSD